MSELEASEDLIGTLDQLVADFDGEVGYVVKNLTSGVTLSRDPDRTFPSASTIKWPILTAFHAAVNGGGVDWDTVVDPSSWQYAGGSGVLMHLSSAVRLTYRDAAWLMICVSDNAATNIVIDAIGLEQTNRLMHELIGPELQLLRHAGTGTDAIGDSMGLATAGALARHVELMDAGRLPGSAETLAVARQQVFRSGLARYLREPVGGAAGVTAATKGGMVAGIRNDVGLIEAGQARIAIAVMTARPVESGLGVGDPAQCLIGGIARASVRTWGDPELVL